MCVSNYALELTPTHYAYAAYAAENCLAAGQTKCQMAKRETYFQYQKQLKKLVNNFATNSSCTATPTLCSCPLQWKAEKSMRDGHLWNFSELQNSQLQFQLLANGQRAKTLVSDNFFRSCYSSSYFFCWVKNKMLLIKFDVNWNVHWEHISVMGLFYLPTMLQLQLQLPQPLLVPHGATCCISALRTKDIIHCVCHARPGQAKPGRAGPGCTLECNSS